MRSMKFWHRLLQCNGNRNTTNKYFFSGWFLFLSNFFYGKSDPEWYTVKLYINTEEMRKSTKVVKVGLLHFFQQKIYCPFNDFFKLFWATSPLLYSYFRLFSCSFVHCMQFIKSKYINVYARKFRCSYKYTGAFFSSNFLNS